MFPPLRIQRKKEGNLGNFCEDNLLLSWKNIKTSFVVGVNEVTKALERDELLLVLVSFAK